MPHDVFISYSKEDKTSANALCHHLEEDGIRCWIAPRDVEVGTDWTDSISDAIENARVHLVIFSDKSAKSRHVKSEVRSAFDRGKILVPIRVSNIQPTGGFDHLLGTSHWVDAFPKPLHQYFDQVTLTLRKLIDNESDFKSVQKASLPFRDFALHRRTLAPGVIGIIFVVMVGLGIFLSNQAKESPNSIWQSKMSEQGVAHDSPIETAKSIEDLRRKNDVRSLTPLENDLLLTILPNGVYGYTVPWLINTNRIGIVGGTGVDKISLKQRAGGTAVMEVHKSSKGDIYILGFVSQDLIIYLQNPTRKTNLVITLFFAPYKNYNMAVAIPTNRIVQSDNRSIDDEGYMYINDMTIR